MPLVSVIVPVYNVEEYLSNTISSILSQTFKDFELLLVDDGSIDASGKICDDFARLDTRIHVFHIDNSGPSAARNVGLKYAHGKFVYFMDSDDYLDILTFESCVNEIEKGYDLVSFNYVRESPDGNIIRHSNIKSQTFDFSKKGNLYSFLCSHFLCYEYGWEGWNRFYRRSIIEKYQIRFVELSRIGEDMCFCLCYLFHCNKYHIMNEEYYHYVKREGTLLDTAKNKNNFAVFEEMFCYVARTTNDSFPSEDIQQSVLSCILVIFLEIEISRLRSKGIRDKYIGRIANKSLQKQTICSVASFLKNKSASKYCGYGLWLKYRFDSSIILFNANKLKSLKYYLNYKIYYLVRCIYYLFCKFR